MPFYILLMLMGLITFMEKFGLTLKCECKNDKNEYNCSMTIAIISSSLTDTKLEVLLGLLSFLNETQITLRHFLIEEDLMKSLNPNQSDFYNFQGIEIFKSDISVLIGPESSSSLKKIHSYAEMKELVHIAPLATSTHLQNNRHYPNLIRMVPSTFDKAEALIDLLIYYRYSFFSVIYSDEDHFQEEYTLIWLQARKQGLKELYKYKIQGKDLLNQLILATITSNRPHAVILLTESETGMAILSKAYELGMTSGYGWLWLVHNSVVYNDLALQNTSVIFDGLLALRPAVHESNKTAKFQNFLQNQRIDIGFGYELQKYCDAILAFVAGYTDHCIMKNASLNSIKENQTSVTLKESILQVNISGFSGLISFDRNGKINRTSFDILQTLNAKWIKIGLWDERHIEINNDIVLNIRSSPDVKFHLNIVTIIEKPFVFFSSDTGTTDNPDDLDGFCIDLLKKLSERIGFSYTLKLVSDGEFGAYDNLKKSWTGMIGEITEGQVELAVASITATKERSDVVNFLPTFLEVGLKFIYNVTAVESKREGNNQFAFLFPFNISLYSGIILSVILMACFLCLLSKLSPYGIRGQFFLSSRADQLQSNRSSNLSHRAKRQLQEDKKDAERGMGLNNALYFVWAALFWQTPERVPRSVSARVVTVAWYLAAVVFLASYTANMVAVISANRDKTRLESLSDLSTQNTLHYGTVINSAVETTLKQSDILLAKRLHKFLLLNPSERLVPTFANGLQRVRKGAFSLLWDSISLDYAAIESDCKLKTVEVGFGSVEYAFAISKNSSHSNLLSLHLDRLKENGYLNWLCSKYFSKLSSCESAYDSKRDLPHQLSFQDLAGLFYLVGISMAVGLLVLLGEWFMIGIYDVSLFEPTAPKTIREALRRRKNRVIDDVKRNCFPLETLNQRWSHLAFPTQPLAEKVIQHRLADKFSGELHLVREPMKTSKSDEALNRLQK